MEKASYDIEEAGNEFDYEEDMGPKECLGFFEAHLLP
jgi:hypothetical protein